MTSVYQVSGRSRIASSCVGVLILLGSHNGRTNSSTYAERRARRAAFCVGRSGHFDHLLSQAFWVWPVLPIPAPFRKEGEVTLRPTRSRVRRSVLCVSRSVHFDHLLNQAFWVWPVLPIPAPFRKEGEVSLRPTRSHVRRSVFCVGPSGHFDHLLSQAFWVWPVLPIPAPFRKEGEVTLRPTRRHAGSEYDDLSPQRSSPLRIVCVGRTPLRGQAVVFDSVR